MEFLGDYKNNYEDIFNVDENNISKIFKGYNKKEGREICLKVIDKKQIELGDYDFILEQIKREEEITKLCKSENIINFYQKLETQNNIIFELEYYSQNIMEYISNNGELRREPENFKNIILSLANALLIIHIKGVMNRY